MYDFDVIIVGGGISGITCSLILAHAGLSVAVVDAHTTPGGCAGYFTRKDHTFEVGATTFVSFQTGGIADKVFSSVGIHDLPLERIKEYQLCLPDRTVYIPDTWDEWSKAWCDAFPELGSQAQPFFQSLSTMARRTWRVAERFPSLPLTTWKDVKWSLSAWRPSDLDIAYWMFRPFEAWLHSQKIQLPQSLRAAFNMLLQDTTQTHANNAPAAFAFLGLTLMPYGLFQTRGSSKQLFERFLFELNRRGGVFLRKHRLQTVARQNGGYELRFARGKGAMTCKRLISAIPVWNMYELAPELFNNRLEKFLVRRQSLDSAFSLYMGIKDDLPETQCNHYQILSSYDEPLGDGNNFLLSLSSKDDFQMVPRGRRSMTISTHTNPHHWHQLDGAGQDALGRKIVARFISASETVLPNLSEMIDHNYFFPASPKTYQKFTSRYMGMVGNQGLGLWNTGVRAIPQTFGDNSFYQTGDTTFPGVGTVSCILSATNVARKILSETKHGDFLTSG